MNIYLVIGNDKNVAAFETKIMAEDFVNMMKASKKPDGTFHWIIWKIEEIELVLESDND